MSSQNCVHKNYLEILLLKYIYIIHTYYKIHTHTHTHAHTHILCLPKLT